MRDTKDRPAAPDFTTACIVMFGVNLIWLFVLIWSLWGLAAVVLAGWGINRLIDRIGTTRG